ncbi:tyrosine-type recombinase/integrase [Bacillus cereus]|uniref:tyrosine-type recombinase/integrase n=1 Tax=Bacillus cereus TaxID=1396 RepID=UPI00124C47A7|nr:site-specific integrase [Bacillus cereus]KAB2397324.1 site-specific integrase [Bacillus cereus]
MQETEDTIQGFSSYLLSKGRKPSTIKRYIYDVKSFIQWLYLSKRFSYKNVWESLLKKDFEVFFTYLKDDRKYSDKTIHRIYIVLSRLYDYLDLPSPIEAVIYIDPPDRKLRAEDFITFKEEKHLIEVTASLEGLTDKQRSVRPMILERNMAIISLFLDYGLSLKELVSLQIQHVHFENNTLSIPEDSKINRIVHLEEKHKLYLYNYYKTIPEPVRPKYHSNDPLFVAFDFTRGTYHWSYDDDAPKYLTEISIQKMIRLEVKRANLRKGIAAQHFRNTYILKQIQKKNSPKKIMQQVGFKSNLSLKRYYDYYKHCIANTE